MLRARALAQLRLLRSAANGSRRFSSGEGAKAGSLWARYNELLEKHPLSTKAVTSAVIAAVGDLTCQLGFTKEDMDWGRFTKFTFLGLVLMAPPLHFWYGALMRYFPGTAPAAVMTRLALDQFLFAPLFVTTVLTTMTVMDGKPKEVGSKLEQDLFPTIRANWALWIPAQFINFRLVPARYQVLWANMVGFVWNIYLSFVSFKSIEAPPAPKKASA